MMVEKGEDLRLSDFYRHPILFYPILLPFRFFDLLAEARRRVRARARSIFRSRATRPGTVDLSRYI